MVVVGVAGQVIEIGIEVAVLAVAPGEISPEEVVEVEVVVVVVEGENLQNVRWRIFQSRDLVKWISIDDVIIIKSNLKSYYLLFYVCVNCVHFVLCAVAYTIFYLMSR